MNLDRFDEQNNANYGHAWAAQSEEYRRTPSSQLEIDGRKFLEDIMLFTCVLGSTSVLSIPLTISQTHIPVSSPSLFCKVARGIFQTSPTVRVSVSESTFVGSLADTSSTMDWPSFPPRKRILDISNGRKNDRTAHGRSRVCALGFLNAEQSLASICNEARDVKC